MAANTAVVIVGSDSEGEESSTRKKRRQTTSSSSEVVDLTLASAHAAARGRQRNVGGDVGNASSSVSTVVEIQAGKRGTQKEVVFVLSDESDPEYSQTNGQTTSTTTINTKTDAQVALELQIQEWAPAKKTEKKKFKQKRGKGAVKVSSSAAKASSSAVNVKSPSSNVPSNYLAPSSQDVTFLAQNGASVHRSGTSFQFPPYQPPFQSPFLQPSSFQQPSYVPPSTSNSNYLTPASSIQPPTPSSYFPPASSNLPTRVEFLAIIQHLSCQLLHVCLLNGPHVLIVSSKSCHTSSSSFPWTLQFIQFAYQEFRIQPFGDDMKPRKPTFWPSVGKTITSVVTLMHLTGVPSHTLSANHFGSEITQ